MHKLLNLQTNNKRLYFETGVKATKVWNHKNVDTEIQR